MVLSKKLKYRVRIGRYEGDVVYYRYSTEHYHFFKHFASNVANICIPVGELDRFIQSI